MPINVGAGSFKTLAKALEGGIANAATGAMRATAPETKRELREQITSAGLGQRLANTWRDRVYPAARQSVTPAGYIWSNAPDIVDSYIRGATIVPVAGSRYLAIPTDNVPKRRGSGRGARKQMTPAEVEQAFGADLFYQREHGPRARLLAFINQRGRGGRGREKRLLMFVLVPSVRKPKLLDLDVPAERWTRRFETEFSERVAAV